MAIVLILALSLFTQHRWIKTYGSSGFDTGREVRQTSDRGYIIAGTTTSFGADSGNIYLIRTNYLGELLWTKNYGGDLKNRGAGVRQTADGGYVVLGMTRLLGSPWYDSDIYLIKTNASGETLWTKTYGDTENIEYGISIDKTVDSGYIIIGVITPTTAKQAIYLIKTNSQGDTIWSRKYKSRQINDGARSGQQTTDGGYIITGYSMIALNFPNVYLIKTDSQGDTLWTKTYGGFGQPGWGECVQQTTDGGYIIAGCAGFFSPADTSADVWLIKTDPRGDTLWTKKYGGNWREVGYSVHQTFDGGYIVCGETYSFGAGESDVYLIRANNWGDTLWTRTYGGQYEEKGYSVRQTSDSGIVTCGHTYSFGAGNNDVYVIKTDANGIVEIKENIYQTRSKKELKVSPNPFVSYTTVSGQNQGGFWVYDISGRMVGWYKGNRIGRDLTPGIYFICREKREMTPQRIVKVR